MPCLPPLLGTHHHREQTATCAHEIMMPRASSDAPFHRPGRRSKKGKEKTPLACAVYEVGEGWEEPARRVASRLLGQDLALNRYSDCFVPDGNADADAPSVHSCGLLQRSNAATRARKAMPPSPSPSPSPSPLINFTNALVWEGVHCRDLVNDSTGVVEWHPARGSIPLGHMPSNLGLSRQTAPCRAGPFGGTPR